MPNFAIYNNQIVTATDIYKFNIDKASEFLCFTCNKQLHFRQSRNADANFTEHFYHQNTIRDTHIECEKQTINTVRSTDTWHTTISNLMKPECREIVRHRDAIKHITDAYDSYNDMGIEFQCSPISVEDIQSRDATTHLEWIFNVKNQYMRKVTIGNKVLCEIPHDNWEKAVKAVKNRVYLYTGYKEWIFLENRENYHVEIDNKRRNVWIGTPTTFVKIYHDTCLENIISAEGIAYFQAEKEPMPTTRILYARCKKSMFLLDSIHRHYVNKHTFNTNEVIAIKSVAGSGKTTTLLELAKIHSDKRILYVAFNTGLITEIKSKIKAQHITNMYPYTFDALIRRVYTNIKKQDPIITYLSPQNVQDVIPWLKDKNFGIRKDIVTSYEKFCKQHQYATINEYCAHVIKKDKPLLRMLWEKTQSGKLNTFDGLRKLSLNEHWFKAFIDKNYDIIMIDETQDFDMMMLRMLLDDTTIPKIFVGDPKQSIYKWRGCINGFDHMPKDSLIVEFYSTFRVGDPACEIIRQTFDDCWMISKSKNTTTISNDVSLLKDTHYTYLFRTWKNLLKTAQTMERIWIHGYDEKVVSIRKLHERLHAGKSFNEDEFEDDLPKFLKTISKEDLDTLIDTIDENMTQKEDCVYKMYTVHAYKGLEDDSIRIADDIDKTDENIYYVALTRGMKYVILDSPHIIEPLAGLKTLANTNIRSVLGVNTATKVVPYSTILNATSVSKRAQLASLKDDIKELKAGAKDFIQIMNALYDFEEK